MDKSESSSFEIRFYKSLPYCYNEKDAKKLIRIKF